MSKHTEIRIIDKCWATVSNHLFSREAKGERFAFFLAETSKLHNGDLLFISHRCILVEDHDVETKSFHAEIRLDRLLEIINEAIKEKKSLIEIHSHPDGLEGFSKTDMDGFLEFVPYVQDSLQGRPYAAIVLTKSGTLDAFSWDNNSQESAAVEEVRIVGDSINSTSFYNSIHFAAKKSNKRKRDSTFANVNEERSEETEGRYARQILLFGEEGQRKIRACKVAIVGLGGLGSHIAQQLAFLGVRNFVLVDPDLVDKTNLNRLIGATPQDDKKTKVEVAERHIQNITNGLSTIAALAKDLRNADVFDELKRVHVIFGCIDNDGPRLILNDLALAYLVNYIDCASGINQSESDRNKIESAGGRVVAYSLTGPCLECANELDMHEAGDYLSPEADRRLNRKQGYVKDVESPSVVSLNGTIASLAVTEFMMLVTQLRASAFYTIYDMLEVTRCSTTHRSVQINKDCIHHQKIGIGDKTLLQRYIIQPDKQSSLATGVVSI